MLVPGRHIGHQKMVLIRCSKILLVASVALFTTLVVFNNITDYGSNYAFVEHVLRMDTTFPNNKGMWRAITSPTLHHAAYMLIILVEGITALFCWAGAIKLLGALRKGVIEFNRAKNVAIAGLTLDVTARQPSRTWRDRLYGRDAVARYLSFVRQVVRLVEHEQAVAVAQPVHVSRRGVVGGHGQVQGLVVASPNQAHLPLGEGGPQERVL
jgi:predicted small integral membrane protein